MNRLDNASRTYDLALEELRRSARTRASTRIAQEKGWQRLCASNR